MRQGYCPTAENTNEQCIPEDIKQDKEMYDVMQVTKSKLIMWWHIMEVLQVIHVYH